ncbi:MAG: response regulator [Polyangiales bacterium]
MAALARLRPLRARADVAKERMATHTSLRPHAEWFSRDEMVGLAALRSACEEHIVDLAGETRTLLRDVLPPAKSDSMSWRARESAELLGEVRFALGGEFGPLARSLTRYGARLARRGVELSRLSASLEHVKRRVVGLIVAAYVGEADRLESALCAAQRFGDRALATITQEYLSYREHLADEQRRSKDAAVLRFTRLYESNALGIIVCEVGGPIREANDAFLAMTGYGKHEIADGEVAWSEMTPPESRSLDEQALTELQETGRTRLWETEYFRKDGSRMPILVGVAMLQGNECVAFVLDISERKRAEELRARSLELEAENQRIQEASRLKSEFLANMSHELRTPLNSIIGFADLLYDQEFPTESPQFREFLGDILNSGRHLLRLINDVLDLAKIEAGKMEFRPEPTDLTRVVSEVLDVLRPVAQQGEIRLHQHVDPDIGEVLIDPGRLKQVFYNYLSNALKFTPPGGRVEVRVRAHGSHEFRLEVEDDGIGIDALGIKRLFIEFEQLDHGITKRHAGTGLGLALTKRIVESQGGTVDVRSTLGKGSVFSAVLPVHAHTRPSQLNLLLPQRMGGPPQVLVVDDDLHDQSIIVRMLNAAGYQAEPASNGAQAIAACEARAFDAITLDLLLPDLSGLEVLQHIRRAGKNRATPVVVVSVVAEQGVVQGSSVHDYLQKPIQPGRLVETLRSAGVRPDHGRPILVIDDDPGALKLMQTSLTRLGYAVAVCADTESALAAVSQSRFAAVILDLMMSEVDGFEFLTRFRRRPEHRDTPVIVWTVKDLTIPDRARLQEYAQCVLAKGAGRRPSLADELRVLMRVQPVGEARS